MRLHEFMAQNGQPLAVEAGQHLFRQGDVDPRSFLLKKGLLKAYYLTSDGKEFIKSFFQEGTIVGSLRATFENTPAPFSVIALEPCELLQFPMDRLRKAAEQDFELCKDVLDVLVKLAIRKERREEEFLTLSAADTYRQLQRESPGLLERVTQNDIARYLGITPVALSRIRSRLGKG